MPSSTVVIYYAVNQHLQTQVYKLAIELLGRYNRPFRSANISTEPPSRRSEIELSGIPYPVARINGRYMSLSQLESELKQGIPTQSPPVTQAPNLQIIQPSSPISPQTSHHIDLPSPASPPGPRSIFMPQIDSSSTSNLDRRFGADIVEEMPSLDRGLHEFEYDDQPLFPETQYHAPSGSSIASSSQASSSNIDFGFSAEPSRSDASSSSPTFSNDHLNDNFSQSSSISGIGRQNSADKILPKISGVSIASSSISSSSLPNQQLDPRTSKLVSLFQLLKKHCQTAEFKRHVNLLGKTLDIVQTQTRSVWSIFGFGGGSGSDQNSQTPPNRRSSLISDEGQESQPQDDNELNSSPVAGSPSAMLAPEDTETTFTVLVTRRNWYGRDQYRFLRFGLDSITRMHIEPPHDERDRTLYSTIVSARVHGSIIHFTFQPAGNAPATADAYDFGDPTLASHIASSLSFLKGSNVPVSFVGN